MDFTTIIDADLTALLGEVYAEVQRRQALTDAPKQVVDAQTAYLTARDQPTTAPKTKVTDWPKYVPPTGAHDSYPYGYVVRDANKLWSASRTDKASSTYQPSITPAEWTDVTYDLLPELKPAGTLAWSATTDYKVGDQVTHNSSTWECLLAHGKEQQGAWEPSAATPTIWKKVN